jgi:hypothetical protein
MLIWIWPRGPLDGALDYEVEIEADHRGVQVMVARDQASVPHAVAVAVGEDPTDFADALLMWGLASPDDSNEPPRDWFT